jgi:hypothetical protein
MRFPLSGAEQLANPGGRLRLLWQERNYILMPGVYKCDSGSPGAVSWL